jgi:hypothetical protein
MRCDPFAEGSKTAQSRWLDEAATIDHPHQADTAKMLEGTMPAAAEQGQTIPTQLNGALCPVCAGG